MACRFPGGVATPDGLWRLLLNGVDAISDIPADRFDVATYYDATPATRGKVATRYGGFLDQIDHFDPLFFGISPREAERLDPQQRLLLETAWEALEDAGQVPARVPGNQVGVFIGMWLSDFEARLFADPAEVDFYMTTGSGRYSASGRLSYFFGFQGPSFTIDTACSSSLVAVHEAVQSLRSGECRLALAGAANVILQPHITIAYSQSRMMAPDGRCKFGDARANGYVRSEGCGMLVVKRLSDALADRDPIHAVILGSAVNNDGRSSGFLTTPGSAGQEDVLRKAYHDAGISPGRVQYVEAHGTGTSAGDPVEITALATVLSADRPGDQPCHIGSIKTNIGHTEGAAGLAGLIKVVLSLKHKQIPASLHVREPNPALPWSSLPVVLQRDLGPWPEHEGLALAGVSAFGIAGTNAHVVLQEAPDPVGPPAPERSAYLLPLSAQSAQALSDLARAYQAYLNDPAVPLADVCYTAGVRRAHHDYRAAIVGQTRAALRDQLAAAERGETRSDPAGFAAPRRIAFVFPGQGSQWIGMGRQLLAGEPVFRAALERFERAAQPFVDWSLIEQLTAAESHSRFEEIDVIQPVLCAVEIALAEVWRARGIEPDAVIGHSMGEVAAACVAGAISLEDAARIICLRSRLMKRVSGTGAMAVVEMSIAQAREAIQGYEDRLSIAVSNGLRSTVISGDPTALTEVMTAWQQREIFCRRVKVDVAAHSPHMDALRGELVAALSELRPQATTIPIYSTVTGELIDGQQLDAVYWGRNLREPVLFAGAVQRSIAAGLTTFIELSPHPILLPAIEQGGAAAEVVTVPSLRREEDELITLLRGLGMLYTVGHDIDWQRLYPAGRCVSLPGYPWQRERFWFEPAKSAPRSAASIHPLLGTQTESSLNPGTQWWTLEMNLADAPFLADHRVRDTVVLPAAAYLDMALAAGQAVFAQQPVLRNVVFKEALVLSENQTTTLQLVIMPDKPGTASFQISSRLAGTETAAWTLHASGLLHFTTSEQPVAVAIDEVMARCSKIVAADEHYQAMRTRGLEYGPGFQGVAQIRRGGAEALAQVQLPQLPSLNGVRIHPSLLDACLQVLVATEDMHAHDPYLPISVEQLAVYGTVPNSLQAYVVRHSNGDVLSGDVTLLADSGEVVAVVTGAKLQRLQSDSATNLERLFYALEWSPTARSDNAQSVGTAAQDWLIFADAAGHGAALAAHLAGSGAQCVVVHSGAAYRRLQLDRFELNPAQHVEFEQLFAELSATHTAGWRGIVYLWGLDQVAVASADQTSCVSALHLVQTLAAREWAEAPRLWLVTSGAQAIAGDQSLNVAQSPLWGLGGVIAHEHPDLHCTRIDLSAMPTPAEIEALRQEIISGNAVDQVALRNTARYVARLTHAALGPRAIAATSAPPDAAASAEFQVSIAQPGILDRMELRAAVRTAPQAGHVEIEVHTTGLNFMNVLSVLGICPGYPNGLGPLGIECAGRIAAVGEGVVDFQVGDRVTAVAFNSLGTHVHTDARLVQPMPAELTFEQAASLPIAFGTAYYALHHLARLQRGERVLIHAAAGGVGLAAIQVARWLGAEVYATAGNPEKRAYLQTLGVQHIMDSRSLSFAAEVLALTDGQGVDVVLNSLAGEAVARSLEALAPYGRFVEIGKRDIYQNTQLGLWPFQKNLSYFAVDLDRMARERPAHFGAVLREVRQLVAEGIFTPLPLRVFPVSQAADAFRLMAQAKHIGKIVIDVKQVAGAAVLGAQPDRLVRPDGTYLITGGLGGLGLEVATWLTRSGARHLVLLGRRDRSSLPPHTIAVVSGLERQGAQVLIATADVAREDQLTALLQQIDQTLPPLRGIIHAAGVLDDGILLQQSAARFQKVMAPKIDGAWQLHRLTRDRELDFFVLFSSVASLLGTAGQGNYAAGNAFLDGLAQLRRTQGLPALSINWGPWSEVGLAAQRDLVGLQSLRGIDLLDVDLGIKAFEHVLASDAAQLAVMPFDAREWCSAHPVDAPSALFSELLRGDAVAAEQADRAAAAPTSVRQALLAVEPGRRRRSILETFIQEQAAQVLRLPPSRIEPHKPLRTLGFDSLMTLEFRNRLEQGLGLSLSATLVWNYPTVYDLAPYLAGKMEIPLESAADTEPAAVGDTASPSELGQLSAAELEALLNDELASVDELLKGLSPDS
jgi:acyl transferase domain-containing protein/acyl carrier protein